MFNRTEFIELSKVSYKSSVHLYIYTARCREYNYTGI